MYDYDLYELLIKLSTQGIELNFKNFLIINTNFEFSLSRNSNL